jgi:translation initiation factor IF-2
LDNEEVAVRVVSSGVGVINESDVHTASTAGAIIYGFHTNLPSHVKQLVARDKVSVRLYTVIYELIDDVICGGQVTKGTLRTPALARVYRAKDLIADNLEITKLQRGPTEVSEVPEGEMCGLSFRSDKRVEIQENDRIELFTRQVKQRTL